MNEERAQHAAVATTSGATRRAASRPKLVDPKSLSDAIDSLETLDPPRRSFLKRRWLEQVIYWDHRSRTARRKYFGLRSVVVVGGISITTLSSTELSTQFPWAVPALAALVAISAAVEGLFGYGETWLQKRNAAELLKVEGWQFFQLAGPYKRLTHGEAYPDFAGRVEMRIAEEIGGYVDRYRPGQPEGSATPPELEHPTADNRSTEGFGP